MKRQQVLIHSAYWVVAFSFFLLCYSLIDSIGQGVIYAIISFPLIIGVTYFFIYWVVPNLLFKEKYNLFILLTATIFLGVLNLQIVFALNQRIFLAKDIAIEVAFIHWDIVYLMISTILLSLPAIAYETLRNWTKKQKEISRLSRNEKEEYIEVRSSGKTHRITCDKIQYIESYGDYAHLHLVDQKIVTRITLKKLEELLSNFVRVHRSFIVNPNYCHAFNLDEIIIENKEIPVGRTYRENVIEVFKLQ